MTEPRKLRLAFDFVSIESYLAIKPTLVLAKKLQVDCEFLPFKSAASRPTIEPLGSLHDEDVGERHRRIKYEYNRMNAARYARVQGIPLSRDFPEHDSEFALCASLSANQLGCGPEFVQHVFQRYWAAELAVDNQAEVLELLRNIAQNRAVREVASASDLDAQRETLEEQGVFSVPTYLICGELFQGREHLPLVESLLKAA